MPLQAELELKAAFFQGLADPSRLAIIEALRGGPLGVSALVEATGLSQPNVSNHLALLRAAGLVVGAQRGRQVVYRLADQRVSALLILAEGVLSEAAGARYRAVHGSAGRPAPAGTRFRAEED